MQVWVFLCYGEGVYGFYGGGFQLTFHILEYSLFGGLIVFAVLLGCKMSNLLLQFRARNYAMVRKGAVKISWAARFWNTSQKLYFRMAYAWDARKA